MEILAWLTVVGIPVAIVGYLVYRLFKWINESYWTSPYEEHLKNDYVPAWRRSMYQNVETTKVHKQPKKPKSQAPSPLNKLSVEFPEITGLDEESWNAMDEPDVDSRKIVNPGARVYRIYRSLDQVNWAECDPALTERAACNYAQYIKLNNPHEYVRCNDPEGLILVYE